MKSLRRLLCAVQAERGCAPQGSGLEEDLLCADDGNDLLYPKPRPEQAPKDDSFRYLNSGAHRRLRTTRVSLGCVFRPTALRLQGRTWGTGTRCCTC